MKQMKMLLALVLCLALTLTVSLALAAGYTAGTYTAEANGNNGPVKVSVTVSADAITAVEVTEHAETPGLSDPARPVLGQHLASETVDRVIYLYAAVWVPILP